jgi:hypothetical protein
LALSCAAVITALQISVAVGIFGTIAGTYQRRRLDTLTETFRTLIWNFQRADLLLVMEQKQPEWVQLFGARMRTEHVPSVTDPVPTAIAAKLQAIEDAEQQLRLRESEHTPGKRCT